MPIFGKKINVCKMCESTAGDEPFTFKSGEKLCCLCEDCYNAVEAICSKLISKELKKLKKKQKPKTASKKKQKSVKKADA